MLKVTVANWVTPGGHIIDESGLVPDENVELPEDGSEDTQLNKALEILR
jgi:carboxyl-terminal processing protease